MEPSSKSHANLFQVYLRLRPPPPGGSNPERFLRVEDPEDDEGSPTHITLNPPNDRRRAIEKFAFTRVFEEDATQLDLFQGTKVLPLVEGVLAAHGGDGTDGLLATLGVTGSGKTHTILGSRSQRGLTQLALDVLYRSINNNIVDCNTSPALEASIQASDASEANLSTASAFLETTYSDFSGSRGGSRAATPMIVRPQNDFVRPSLSELYSQLPGKFPDSPGSVRLVRHEDDLSKITLLSTPPNERPRSQIPSAAACRSRQPKLARTPSPKKHYMCLTSAAQSKKTVTKTPTKGEFGSSHTPRRNLQRPSAFPQVPDISSIRNSCDPSAEYAIVISMYEVYNDRIFDLLTPPVKSNATKEYRRRPLLFKSTELSPDRKVVAGLRKIICSSLKDALLVLEAGLHERRVAGTGSNSVSSRSHGFFCVEVKKRRRGRSSAHWGSSTLSIVDLAGSERARDAKTQGATLAEAGKINESLMYLGQCLQMQSDASSMSKPNLVPFRQCKLTELLFSNSFPSASAAQSVGRRNPQRGVMIVTADPFGDFNATSQILRYSALAREVTVPRIPSITATILAGAHANAAAAATAAVASSSSTHSSQQSSEFGSSPPLSSPLSNFSNHNNNNNNNHRPYFQQQQQQQHQQQQQQSGSFRHHHPNPNHHHTHSYNHNSHRHQQDRHHQQRTFSPETADTERGTMENAALEIARMAEAIEQLHADLAAETAERVAAEAHLLSLEERALELEQDVREECYADFERRLALEMGRWKASLDMELDRGTEHWDRKVELLQQMGATTATTATVVVTSPSSDGGGDYGGDENGGRLGRGRGVGMGMGMGVEDDDDDKENVLIENLEQENERLRREVAVLRRELAGRTPTKRAPLQERGDVVSSGGGGNNARSGGSGVGAADMAGLGSRLEGLRVSGESDRRGGGTGNGNGNNGNGNGNGNGNVNGGARKKGINVASNGSPTKKVRKLPTRRWDAADDDEF